MTDAPALAVTGASGAVGRLTAEELSRDRTPLRLLTRSPERAPALPGAVVVAASYGDCPSANAALHGVRTLFMVSAAEEEGWLDQQLAFVGFAAAAGVEHIVYTSFQSAAPDARFSYARDHYVTEQAIRDSGMAWTILRDNFYLDFLALLPGADGALRAPAGDGKVAAIAKVDVARAAAAVLRDPSAHSGRTYELTGPHALDFTEITNVLATAWGRPIHYIEETEAEARASRAQFNPPGWQEEGWISTYLAIAAGDFERVTDDVERLTGQPPISLRDLVGT